MEGWLLLLFFVAIGASLVALGLRRRAHLTEGTTVFSDELLASPLAPPQPAAPPTNPAVPPDLVWLRHLLFALHALIIGHSRAGKTTITHFIATARAKLGHQVIVCDPDAAPGMWPGCTVSGYADDFITIEATLQTFQDEIAARRLARTRRAKARLTPLTLVLSEAGDILNQCPSARPVFESVLRRGGKLNISLLVDVQDKQKDTLKIPGATHLLKNFEEHIEVRKEGHQRRVTYRGQDYPIPDLPDLEALADAYAQTHPVLAVEDEPAPLAVRQTTQPISANGYASVPNGPEHPNGHAAQPNAAEHAAERSAHAAAAADQDATTTEAARSGNAPTCAPATPEEIRKLGRALRAYAQHGSKHRAIEAGWGLKRGGGPQYRRAETLFETALAEEPEA